MYTCLIFVMVQVSTCILSVQLTIEKYKERYTDFSLRDIYGILNHMQNSQKSV